MSVHRQQKEDVALRSFHHIGQSTRQIILITI